MHLHGLEVGRPRRLGIDVASVVAGMLAAQGVLAALLGRGPERRSVRITTSVVQGGLLALSQYIARATAGGAWGGWWRAQPADGPGPPFPTADGRWVELETLSPEAWKAFWTSLGVERAEVGPGWNQLRARYATATCSMPVAFHHATGRQTLDQLTELARSCGMSLSPVRSYAEVRADGALAALSHASVRPLPAGDGPSPAGPTILRQSRAAPAVGPLTGFQVVEATSRIQGPLAGQVLHMLGATVARVEPPGGDPARMETPLSGHAGAFFLAMNRGKEPVELDLASAGGRQDLIDLAAGADVFLHNWRPGRAEEWSLGPAALAARNPQLVYCWASGWGNVAERCPPIGMEYLVQAYTGLGSGLRPEGEVPRPTELLLCDFMGGLLASEAILGGLHLRRDTGRGYVADSSLAGGAMALQAHVLEGADSGRPTRRRDGRPVWGPLDDAIEAGDGFVAVDLAEVGEGLDRFRAAVGLNARHEGAEEVRRRFIDRSATDWEQLLLDAGIPCRTVRRDLAGLPTDRRLSPLLEPVGATASAPAPPWSFES